MGFMKIGFLLLSVVISFPSFSEQNILTQKEKNLIKDMVASAYQQYPEIVMMLGIPIDGPGMHGTGFFINFNTLVTVTHKIKPGTKLYFVNPLTYNPLLYPQLNVLIAKEFS